VKFVDSCKVTIVAGAGGNGCVAFRREKYVPFGGPAGGDGGKGGDVVFVGDDGKTTLLDVALTRRLTAERGEHGRGKDQYGKAGRDLVVHVPVGTQGVDPESGERVFDVDAAGKSVVVARGGRGGRGNIHFKSAQERAPRRAEPGEPGDEKTLRLELKVMADVGLLGFPNVGKSTFIRAVSRARPKVADYPFTTLVPHLGVVAVDSETSFVIADIPGLIPGAARGAGLGIRFLKHLERTRALLHLLTPEEGDENRDPLADFDALNAELAEFDAELAARPQIVAMNKADLTDARRTWTAQKKRFARRGIDLHLVSAATGEGVRELIFALHALVKPQAARGAAEDETADEAPAPRPRAEKAPAEKAPAKKAPAKKAPAKKTPAKKTPAKKAPAR
jgi:GTP-binding protein